MCEVGQYILTGVNTMMIAVVFQVWEKAGTQGLLGIDTAEENGGLGSDFLTASIVLEEQSVDRWQWTAAERYCWFRIQWSVFV